MFDLWFFEFVVGGALFSVLASIFIIFVLFLKDIKGKQLW